MTLRLRFAPRPFARLTVHTCRLLAVLAMWMLFFTAPAVAETWAEKLGFPSGHRVLLLHADDIGMCYEANEAAKHYLASGSIQSAGLMVPCPWFNEMANWYRENPDYCIGLHLAMNSEWKFYRWGPVAPAAQVPGMIDEDGYLWKDVPFTVLRANAKEIETEIRAQIERALAKGIKPSHIDTHMGCLYARPDYTEAFLRIAQEYHIPANVIEMTPRTIDKFRKQGYPITDDFIRLSSEYKLPRLDDFHAAPNGKTYEEKLANFFQLVRDMEPGLNEIIFHPSVETEGLRHITGSWQQRVWEGKMFDDPQVKSFFEHEEILFTSWKDIMKRWDERTAAGN